MDRKAVAKEIRKAIFDQAEEDGRVMHGDAMDRIIEQVLAKHDLTATPTWPYSGTYTVLARDKNITVTPYQE